MHVQLYTILKQTNTQIPRLQFHMKYIDKDTSSSLDNKTIYTCTVDLSWYALIICSMMSLSVIFNCFGLDQNVRVSVGRIVFFWYFIVYFFHESYPLFPNYYTSFIVSFQVQLQTVLQCTRMETGILFHATVDTETFVKVMTVSKINL